MSRLVAAVITLTVLAVVGSPLASAAPRMSNGMAAEFPVGQCIAIPTGVATYELDMDDLTNLRSVPCTDPARNYRVVAQVAYPPQCGSEAQNVYFTKDVRVLCVVQDYVGM